MSLTIKETIFLLKELNKRPIKTLGQNFLIEKNVVELSLSWAKLEKNDTVVEIGPGLGTLTRAILDTEAKLFAVEKDKILYEHLKTFLSDYKNLHLLNGDAVEYPLANAPESNLDSFKIVANLPYAISGPWLEKVLTISNSIANKNVLPSRMVLLAQKEAVDRWLAVCGCKNFGPLSIFLQSAYRLSNLTNISKKCFYPAPKVDSVLVCLEKIESPVIFSSAVVDFIRKVFCTRRQQIKRICSNLKDDKLANRLINILETNQVPLNSRPEEININVWQKLNSSCE